MMMQALSIVLVQSALLAPAVVGSETECDSNLENVEILDDCGDVLKCKVAAINGNMRAPADTLNGMWYVLAQINPQNDVTECNTAQFNVNVDDGTYESTFNSGSTAFDNFVQTPFSGQIEQDDDYYYLRPYFNGQPAPARSWVAYQEGSGDDEWAVLVVEGPVPYERLGYFRSYPRCHPQSGFFVLKRSPEVSQQQWWDMQHKMGPELGFETRSYYLKRVTNEGCAVLNNEDISAKFQPQTRKDLKAAVRVYCGLEEDFDATRDSGFPPISEWDTSLVENFDGIFADLNNDCGNPDLNGWATAQVTSMKRVFKRSYSINPDISGWITSKVISFNSMFSRANKFSGSLAKWDTASALDMSLMFEGAFTYLKKPDLIAGDLTKFDTSKVKNFKYMFGSKFGVANFGEHIREWSAFWNTGSTEVEFQNFRQDFKNFRQECPPQYVSKGDGIYGSIAERCFSATANFDGAEKKMMMAHKTVLEAEITDKKARFAGLENKLVRGFAKMNVCGDDDEIPPFEKFEQVPVEDNDTEEYKELDQATQDLKQMRVLLKEMEVLDSRYFDCFIGGRGR